jgi:hypothetical protein
MQMDTGIIKVIQMDALGGLAARTDCRESLIPNPGEYLLAYNLEESNVALGRPLFQVGSLGMMDDPDSPFLGPIPQSWTPGARLTLRGPLGHGFNIPREVRRLALAAFGDTETRLLPLIKPAIQSSADIAIFTNTTSQPESLPPDVEIQPLSALPENLSWATYLAIDIPVEKLVDLRKALGLEPHDRIPYPAQVLVWANMPCGGLAECGTCAVPTRKSKIKLTCTDGPVFDFNELDW